MPFWRNNNVVITSCAHRDLIFIMWILILRKNIMLSRDHVFYSQKLELRDIVSSPTPIRLSSRLESLPALKMYIPLEVSSVSPQESSHTPSWVATQKSLVRPSLSHRDRDKMAVVLQTNFSRAFSWLKIVVFWLLSQWNMFPWAQLAISQNWLW